MLKLKKIKRTTVKKEGHIFGQRMLAELTPGKINPWVSTVNKITELSISAESQVRIDQASIANEVTAFSQNQPLTKVSLFLVHPPCIYSMVLTIIRTFQKEKYISLSFTNMSQKFRIVLIMQ